MIGRRLDDLATPSGHDALKIRVYGHVFEAHDIRGRLGPPGHHLWRSLQGHERLGAEMRQGPINCLCIAVVVETLCRARRIEVDHVARTHDEARTQVRAPVVRDLPCLYVGCGGARARFAVFEGKSGNVNQVLDRGWTPASVMTAPPYEWPTSTTSPRNWSRVWCTRAMSESRSPNGPSSSPCPGRSTAKHSMSAAVSNGITRSHAQVRCHAPCTKTTVRLMRTHS